MSRILTPAQAAAVAEALPVVRRELAALPPLTGAGSSQAQARRAVWARHDTAVAALCAALEGRYGKAARLRSSPHASTVAITLHGLRATSITGLAGALRRWCDLAEHQLAVWQKEPAA